MCCSGRSAWSTSQLGFNVMLLGFAAAVLGGFGSIGGVVVGGIAIGLVEQLLGGYVLRDYKLDRSRSS